MDTPGTLPSLRPGNDLFFLDEQNGWLVGAANGPNIHTQDGGKTWKGLGGYNLDGLTGLQDLRMFNPMEGTALQSRCSRKNPRRGQQLDASISAAGTHGRN